MWHPVEILRQSINRTGRRITAAVFGAHGEAAPESH
jgi:hypothetical protein